MTTTNRTHNIPWTLTTTHPMFRLALGLCCLFALGCAAASRNQQSAVDQAAKPTLAQIYFWRARPGMSAEYDRYIREVGEPIDREAQRAGAFVDVTTYAASDTTLPWTHMRVFLLRDSSQLRGLGAALSAAGVDKIMFAWYGAPDLSQPHHYRVQGPTFVIEYNNTQNNANHIHSMWRDMAGDFGIPIGK